MCFSCLVVSTLMAVCLMQSRYIVIASLTTCHDGSMAIFRDHPYEGSNFLVDLGVGDPADIRSTFFRVELPDAIIDEVAYRSGNDKTQDSRKQPGLREVRPPHPEAWAHSVRPICGSGGSRPARASPTSTATSRVTLLDEERTAVWSWRFRNAFPVNYRTTPLDANVSDIVVEELTLTFDSMDIE